MSAFLYLDHNATTPVLPEVLDAMLPWLAGHPGNPSSAHPAGEEARDALEAARYELALLAGAEPREILFTSGGTESTNAAIHAALAARPGRRVVVTSRVEHSATLEPLGALERADLGVVRIGVDGQGRLDPDALRAAIDPSVALVTLQTANNETGALSALAGVAEAVHAAGALLHVDAVQSLGKVPLDLARLGADYASLSAHKLHGPKGAGALFVRAGAPFEPLLVGGPQERGRRAGTENLPGIVGFGRAAALARAALADGSLERVRDLRDRFEAGLTREFPDLAIQARGGPRLPNTANVAFAGVDAEELLAALGAAGLCASAGSACHAAARRPSHVLAAMGLSDARLRGAVRFSLGRTTSADEVERAVELVAECASALRAL
ncbi:MAG: cysteine desulfurase [Planctomycetes bacterium]|nr:cysteine desulfurase [Planctomycetota bacterium]